MKLKVSYFIRLIIFLLICFFSILKIYLIKNRSIFISDQEFDLTDLLGEAHTYTKLLGDEELFGWKNCEKILNIDYLKFIKNIYKEKYWKFEKYFLDLKEKEKVEGHSGLKCCQRNYYHILANQKWIKTICETGFNAGHSSFNWLIANPKAKVFSFDIGKHNYSFKMAKYLNKEFPGRLKLIWGNSTISMKKFQIKNPNIKCDLISIDGGHSYFTAKSDFNHFYKMSSKKNILVFDDWPQIKKSSDKWIPYTSGQVWEEMRRYGTVKEHLQCNYKTQTRRGFSVGSFVL